MVIYQGKEYWELLDDGVTITAYTYSYQITTLRLLGDLHSRETQRFILKTKIRNLMREGRHRPITVDMARQFCLIHCIALTFYFLTITYPAISNVILLDKNSLQNRISKMGCLDFQLAVTVVLEGRHPQFSRTLADSHG
ncbi:unnamed protein product [Caenorhabditis nigoni]